MKSYHHLSEEDKQNIYRWIEEHGTPQTEVAEIFGCTQSTVSYHYNRIKRKEKGNEAE